EIAAAAGRQIALEYARRRHRYLDEAGPYLVREARRIGHAVVIVPDRVDARAVAIARVADGVERPEVRGPDREARRAIALHLTAGEVLEDELGELDVGEEELGTLLGRAAMAIAVARELVTAVDDAPHHGRMP